MDSRNIEDFVDFGNIKDGEWEYISWFEPDHPQRTLYHRACQRASSHYCDEDWKCLSCGKEAPDNLRLIATLKHSF